MATMVWTYLLYLSVSIAITVWVAHTLHKNGRIFLVDSFLGNDSLADSVNHLLVVGFYLINVGFISLTLKYGDRATDVLEAIEYLSTKIGLVLLTLGVMHFTNLWVFAKMRRRAKRSLKEKIAEVVPLEAVETATHYLDKLGEARRGAGVSNEARR